MVDVKRIAAAADWSALASSLAGRPVDVYFREPTIGRGGWILGCHWKLRGRAVVEVSPTKVTDERFLEILLHEIAHARLHYDGLHDWPTAAAKLANGRRLAEQPATEPTATYYRHEDEAWALSERWLSWCKSTNSLAGKALILGLMAGISAKFPAIGRLSDTAARG